MRAFRLLPFALLVLTTACISSNWPVDHYETPGAGLAAKRTFSWAGGELGSVSAVDPDLATRLDKEMKSTVIAGFVARGFTLVADQKAADMVVRYEIVGTRRYMTTERPRFSAPLPDDVLMQSRQSPPAASELPPERRVTDGSVIVFVDEPGTGRLMWRGVVTEETRSSTNDAAVRTASEMARAIVATFPQRAVTP
jgi:hypothetical protein